MLQADFSGQMYPLGPMQTQKRFTRTRAGTHTRTHTSPSALYPVQLPGASGAGAWGCGGPPVSSSPYSLVLPPEHVTSQGHTKSDPVWRKRPESSADDAGQRISRLGRTESGLGRWHRLPAAPSSGECGTCRAVLPTACQGSGLTCKKVLPTRIIGGNRGQV